MEAKLSGDFLGKCGSESAAAKCAVATQHESHKFSIDEEKPYAEVRTSCLYGYPGKKVETKRRYGWERILLYLRRI